MESGRSRTKQVKKIKHGVRKMRRNWDHFEIAYISAEFSFYFFYERNSAATSAPPPYLCVCDYCRRERVRVNVVTSCCWLRGQVIYGSPYPDWETNISTHNHPLHLSPSLNISLLPPPSSSLPNSILHPLSLIQSSHHPHLPASWFILFCFF